MGAGKNEAIKLLFDRHLRLEFRGAKITTDAGLLVVRKLDDVMGLTEMATDLIADKRTGKNIQHQIPGLLRQSVYARLADYEDTNDHEAVVLKDPINASKKLPWVHILIANVKGILRGVHHGVSPKHLQAYLSEFCWRFSRRRWEGELFDRLLFTAIQGNPLRWRELIGA